MPETIAAAPVPDVGSAVEMLSPPGPATFQEAEAWYAWSSPEHFWFRWRFDALTRFLGDLGVGAGEPLAALDIGCGTGVLRSQLETALGWVVDGADLNLGALRRAAPGRGRLLYYNVFDARPELLERYDAVTVFDVLEHLEDDAAFLEAALRHLKPGGLLLVNVPAAPLLQSRYDTVVGHLRRYDRRALDAACSRLRLEKINMRPWGFCLLPVLTARKAFLALRPRDAVMQSGFVPPGPAAEAVLGALERIEHRLFPRPRAGSSLLLAARKVVPPRGLNHVPGGPPMSAFEGQVSDFPEAGRTREELLARARQLSWYHTLKLDDSLTTPGEFDLAGYVRHYLPTEDLSTADCLDIGSGNGFWSFEMERRRAHSVTAVDLADFVDTDFSILHGRDEVRPTQAAAPGAFGEGLRIAATLLQSKLTYRLASVYDLRPESIGRYDLVHCGSMLMHLFGPLLALQRMASVCRDSFLITTETDLSLEGQSVLAYKGHQIPFVHFIPSPVCLGNMLVSCGYAKVLRGPTFHLRFRNEKANPMKIPHTTFLGLKEGSRNPLGFPAPAPVEAADRQARVEIVGGPSRVRAGEAFDVLVRLENRSGRMWFTDDNAASVFVGVEGAPAARGEAEVSAGHFLPAGLSTLVALTLRAPCGGKKLTIAPFVRQKGRDWSLPAEALTISVS